MKLWNTVYMVKRLPSWLYKLISGSPVLFVYHVYNYSGMEMARYLSTYVPFKAQIMVASYDDMTAK